jgi:predicted transcriptional regulator of viral defense system
LKKGYYSLKELDNKFLLTEAFNDSYLGLHSAMEFYGTTTQRYNSLELISKNNLKNLELKEFGISFHKVNKKLFFGYKKEIIGGVEIFVSDIEKTLIDCIYFSDKVYLSEILEFIKKTSLDKNKLELYLIKINSSTLKKRTGYLLEKCGIIIENLKFNNKYEKLNKNLSNKGEKNTKWKLIINEEL